MAVAELEPVDDTTWPAVVARLSALAAVRSPHLARLLEAGRSDDGTVTWCSLSRGEARPVTSVSGDRRRVLVALAGAARGAHDLHEAGFAHGDIRPTSILVDEAGGLLDAPAERQALCPPAVARFHQATDLDGIEADALWGEGPSRAADVFALGAAAALLLTGQLLHPALATDQRVTAVQRVLLQRPVVSPTMDRALAGVVGACLAPDPTARPESAAALAEDLDRLAAAS